MRINLDISKTYIYKNLYLKMGSEVILHTQAAKFFALVDGAMSD